MLTANAYWLTEDLTRCLLWKGVFTKMVEDDIASWEQVLTLQIKEQYHFVALFFLLQKQDATNIRF